ncbi:MAG: hypothetical protein NC211_08955 [Alistipes senegalensis]|nr:hypothetical protein [Oxalobacter formigenes]MCM1281936.1 hypothetical protein [Alistipes senegalensis]
MTSKLHQMGAIRLQYSPEPGQTNEKTVLKYGEQAENNTWPIMRKNQNIIIANHARRKIISDISSDYMKNKNHYPLLSI